MAKPILNSILQGKYGHDLRGEIYNLHTGLNSQRVPDQVDFYDFNLNQVFLKQKLHYTLIER